MCSSQDWSAFAFSDTVIFYFCTLFSFTYHNLYVALQSNCVKRNVHDDLLRVILVSNSSVYIMNKVLIWDKTYVNSIVKDRFYVSKMCNSHIFFIKVYLNVLFSFGWEINSVLFYGSYFCIQVLN